jgi:hypothetical protein
MRGKYVAGVLVAACLGAVIAAGHREVTQQTSPALVDTPAIIIGACEGFGEGTWAVPLGGAGIVCPTAGVPVHGVPISNDGRVLNLRVTGDASGDALEGDVITL